MTSENRAELWPLDRAVTFLNHGSFGACPAEVLRYQSVLRAVMEAEPVRFLSRELDDRLDVARRALAAFLGADADDLAFVTNATGGVNAVLRSLLFAPGDGCDLFACLDELVANPGLRARMGTAAYLGTRERTWASVNDMLLDYYDQFIVPAQVRLAS